MFKSFAEKVDPAHTALVVVDVQNDFCHEDSPMTKKRTNLEGVQETARRLAGFIGDARAAGIRVIFIQNISAPEKRSQAQLDLASRNNPGVDPAAAPKGCVEGTWGADFYAVEPAPGDIIFKKYRASAFIGTDFKELLESHGIETLLMTGVSTNVCVESTARDGYMLDFHIVLLSDLCGYYIRELHEATLKNINYRFGQTTTSDEVLAAWKAAPVLAGAAL